MLLSSKRAASAALFVLRKHFIKFPRVNSNNANILKEDKLKFPLSFEHTYMGVVNGYIISSLTGIILGKHRFI